jgi:2-keto-3-deoxy-L-rhamnonate aldolase RhmA
LDLIIAAAKNSGRPVGMFTSKPTDAAIWRDKGVSLFLLGSDHGFLKSGAASLRQQFGT